MPATDCSVIKNFAQKISFHCSTELKWQTCLCACVAACVRACVAAWLRAWLRCEACFTACCLMIGLNSSCGFILFPMGHEIKVEFETGKLSLEGSNVAAKHQAMF